MSGLGGRLWELVAYGSWSLTGSLTNSRRNQSEFWLGGCLGGAVTQGGTTVHNLMLGMGGA